MRCAVYSAQVYGCCWVSPNTVLVGGSNGNMAFTIDTEHDSVRLHYTHTHKHTYARTHMHTHASTCTCTHTRTQTHAQVHAHTCMCPVLSGFVAAVLRSHKPNNGQQVLCSVPTWPSASRWSVCVDSQATPASKPPVAQLALGGTFLLAHW